VVCGFVLCFVFGCFILQPYPSTFCLVRGKDLLVSLALAVLACRKRWVWASFLGEASGSPTRIFPVGKTQRLLDCYYRGN